MSMTKPSAGGRWSAVRDGEGDRLPPRLRAEGAFTPWPLPSELDLSQRTYRLLADGQEMLGRLDEAAARLATLSPLVRSTQVREVQLSAQLDGISAALLEVLVSLLPGVKPGNKVTPKVSRYLRASDTGFAALRAGADIDGELMSEVAAAFADTGTTDVWRTDHAWLGGTEAFLLASPPGVETKVAFEQFVTWSAAESDLTVLAKVALGTYLLEVLRPFRYGNGHIARLYVGLELTRSRVLRGQVLPISTWINRNLTAYRAQVRRVADTGEYEPWIAFFAAGVAEVCRDELALIRTLRQTHQDLEPKLKRRTGNIRKVFNGLLATPVTNHRQIAEIHGISNKNANDVCGRLVDAGVLESLGGYGKVYFSPVLVRQLSLTDPRLDDPTAPNPI
ncbi:Fic/DOC family N-terminal domain-containing protein [Actinokineospora auranticolor]|nr:Fic/DOC family N-terminal domain-containing protein [Actinokineospora auranticolor]